MQPRTLIVDSVVGNGAYDLDMARTSERPRPAQGAHILKLRLEAGLTQVELANILKQNQANISFWERSDKPPRSDLLPKMAEALGVSVADLLLPSKEQKPRRGGLVGKLHRTFEKVSELPRAQQQKVIDLVETVLRGMHGAR